MMIISAAGWPPSTCSGSAIAGSGTSPAPAGRPGSAPRPTAETVRAADLPIRIFGGGGTTEIDGYELAGPAPPGPPGHDRDLRGQ